jgi:hypothetical protein
MEEFNSLANAVLKQEQAKMRLVADDALLEDKLVKSAQDLRRMKSLYIAEEINIKEMIYDLKHLNDNIEVATIEQAKINSERNELSNTSQGLRRKIAEQIKESSSRIQDDDEYFKSAEYEHQLQQYYNVGLMAKEYSILLTQSLNQEEKKD